jgi:putative flippase GtrA
VDSHGALAHNATMLEARSEGSRARGLVGWLRDPVVQRQLGRFAVVGVANTLIGLVSYRLLLAVDVPYVIAAPIAWAAGAVNGYVFNRRWTFRARDTTRARILYVLVAAVGAGSASLLVYVFVEGAGLTKLEAFIAAAPVVVVATFVANRVWTFSDRD